MNLRIIIKRILHFFNLDGELENPDVVYEEIKKGVVFEGTNLWILIFAIVVASVGLNVNSTAVIIGAMLISPLMGPINGMGYSIATYDFELFKKSIKNFTFAIIASLFASTTYFTLSPVSTAHSELLARTSPTIYDVIIALFGGFAGIVAISSKQKGNVLPGVAIATALMPPLCTSGYGIATRQWDFFIGAIYLFTINTIFIAMASVWLSQILKFPIRTVVDEKRKKRINQAITVLIVIILLPSIFFGYKLAKQEDFNQKAQTFINSVAAFEGNFLLKSDINFKENKITLVYSGYSFSENQKKEIIKRAKEFQLEDTSISIEQAVSYDNLQEKNFEVFKLKEQIVDMNNTIQKQRQEIDSILAKQKFGEPILKEIRAFFPQVHGCLFSDSFYYEDELNNPLKTQIIILKAENSLSNSDKEKIYRWLKERLRSVNVKVFYESYTKPK